MPIELNARDVEVWVADLDDTRWDRYSGSLNAEERSRAARLRVPLDGERYRRCRGLLRHLLAGYLDRPADRIAFEMGPFGKPGIAADPIRFNVSHSRNIAVIAFARTPIGVDIEFVETDWDDRGLVSQVCTGREAEQLSALPERDAMREFHAIWTRKEAYLKAIGLGLQHPLQGVDIGQGPASRNHYIVDANAIDDQRYHLFDLPVCDGYGCHVCLPVERPEIVVRHAAFAMWAAR